MQSIFSATGKVFTAFRNLRLRCNSFLGAWRPRSPSRTVSARFSRRELLIGLVYASIAIPGIVYTYSTVRKAG